jgi:hypothetical protein
VTAALAVLPKAVEAQRTLNVIVSDTAIAAPPSIPAGLVTVVMNLTGKVRRELVVHRVPSGTLAADVARSAVGRPTKWFERWSFGGPAVPRDTLRESRASMELRPGQYVLVAYEVDAMGRARGGRMIWRSFSAVAASVLIPARFSDADLTIRVKDARGDVSGSIRAGRRAVRVENAGGRPHQVMIARLKPGKTADDVKGWRRDRGDPPFAYVGGLTPMSPGMRAQTNLVFLAGTHVVICPLEEARGGGHDHETDLLATFTVR